MRQSHIACFCFHPYKKPTNPGNCFPVFVGCCYEPVVRNVDASSCYGLQRLHGAYPSLMICSRDSFTSFRFFGLIVSTLEQLGRWNLWLFVFST